MRKSNFHPSRAPTSGRAENTQRVLTASEVEVNGGPRESDQIQLGRPRSQRKRAPGARERSVRAHVKKYLDPFKESKCSKITSNWFPSRANHPSSAPKYDRATIFFRSLAARKTEANICSNFLCVSPCTRDTLPSDSSRGEIRCGSQQILEKPDAAGTTYTGPGSRAGRP